MSSWREIVQQVQARAGKRCEYCRMHQTLQGATFHVEHVVPSSRGGSSTLDNLAWACPICTLRNSPRISVVARATGAVFPLFHPRRESWGELFQFRGSQIGGQTPTGPATVAALDLNPPRRLLIRQAEQLFGL